MGDNGHYGSVGSSEAVTRSAPSPARGRIIHIDLSSGLRRGLVIVLLLLLDVGIGKALLATGVSSVLGSSSRPERWRQAIAWNPANPDFHLQLGFWETFYGPPMSHGGIPELRRATELSPHEMRYWMNLGVACDAVDDSACASDAFAKTLALAPMMPQVHWQAANHEIRINQLDPAFVELRKAATMNPDFAGPVFEISERLLGDPKQVADKVLPDGNPALKVAYLRFLDSHGEPDGAYQVWQGLTTGNAPASLTFEDGESLIEHLLANDRVNQASGIWRDLQRMHLVQTPPSVGADNLVFNGGFELAPVSAAFDWRSQPGQYTLIDFSAPSADEGSHCLRVDFTVKDNPEVYLAYQTIPVTPGQNYELSALVRSDSITSDSGPQLRVQDALHRETQEAITEPVVGTSDWHPISTRFTAGPETDQVLLSVWRARSRTYPTEITGSFWLDAVVLKPLAPGPNNAQE